MFNNFWLRVKALVLRRRFDQDLEEEVAFHLGSPARWRLSGSSRASFTALRA